MPDIYHENRVIADAGGSGGGSGSGGHTILDPSDTAMTQRDNLKFGGDFSVSDDLSGNATDILPHEITNAEWEEILNHSPGPSPQPMSSVDFTGATASAAGTHGLVPAPAPGDQDKFLKGNGQWGVIPTAVDFTGATSSEAGAHGLVPAPAAGDEGKVLKGSGSWGTLSKSDVGLGNVDNTADANKSVNYANSAGSATKLGSSNVGSSSRPMYLNGGTPTQMNDWFNQSVKTDATPNFYAIKTRNITIGDGTYGNAIESNTGLHLVPADSKYVYLRGTITMSILSDGETYTPVFASGFVTASSRRLKKNIEPLTDMEARKILDVDVVSFDYISGDKDQRGVIAEDVVRVIPSVVRIDDNYDETKPISIENTAPSVDYSKFAPYLIKMTQMQQDEIDDLRSDINELKEIINELRK